jgi:hypothetical protein
MHSHEQRVVRTFPIWAKTLLWSVIGCATGTCRTRMIYLAVTNKARGAAAESLRG